MFSNISKADSVYFNAAKAVSELSDHKHKLGCVVTLGHRVISSGHNSDTRCHSIQAKLDRDVFGCDCPGKLHSETMALLPLIRRGVDLSKASIYVYREHKNGNLACARPCQRCEKLIKQCGIKKIHYTVENGVAEERWQ